MERRKPWPRTQFVQFEEIQTRWMDNDLYGHVNNAVDYSYFDTAINRCLIEIGVLDLQNGSVIGVAVETSCNYFKEIAFPERIFAGIRVAHVGRTSVRFEAALFRNDEELAAAQGHFVHVYVDRTTRRPVALSENMKKSLTSLVNQTD